MTDSTKVKISGLFLLHLHHERIFLKLSIPEVGAELSAQPTQTYISQKEPVAVHDLAQERKVREMGVRCPLLQYGSEDSVRHKNLASLSCIR